MSPWIPNHVEFIRQLAAVDDHRNSRTGSENPVLMNRHNSTPIMGLVVNLRLFHLFFVGRVGDRQAADYSGKTRMLN